VQSQRRPDLKEPITRLVADLSPVVATGGAAPLLSLVEAVAGGKLTDKVRRQLEARGGAVFTVSPGGGPASFVNEGAELTIELKSFDIKLPKRLRGQARLIEGGVRLEFDRKETLRAAKLLFTVKLEALELTSRRVFIDMEGEAFDRVYELD
jgi:hypothetical protein